MEAGGNGGRRAISDLSSGTIDEATVLIWWPIKPIVKVLGLDFDSPLFLAAALKVLGFHNCSGRMHQFPMHLSWKKGAEVRRKGFLPLYVGAQGEELQRCVVPVEYINHPLFRKLLNEAEEEYGFDQRAAITIPCQVSELQYVQEVIHKEKHHSHGHQSCFG
ncbi:hypothetical protein KI387_019459 [Taxus chinensis]|uniref:Small auxin up regulated protein n=1 Tax=Taxus chinensis TaxID=29808 RepID=A0AA38LDK5_TAXCH|nr:hypothetical protein KI387_019459 [Taxus chinensis]